MPKIIAFAGSTRRDSFNKKLVQVAADLASDAGGDVTVIDLADFPMPLYDGDLEQKGMPEYAERLYELLKPADGLLLSCPEYNSSITAVLKNAIDWASRPREGDPRLAAFDGKVAALLAASPGALGGLRGLVHVRSILQNIGVTVVPKQFALSQAHEAFTKEGMLKDDKQTEAVKTIAEALVRTTKRLRL